MSQPTAAQIERTRGALTGAVRVLLAAGWTRAQVIALVDETIAEEVE